MKWINVYWHAGWSECNYYFWIIFNDELEFFKQFKLTTHLLEDHETNPRLHPVIQKISKFASTQHRTAPQFISHKAFHFLPFFYAHDFSVVNFLIFFQKLFTSHPLLLLFTFNLLLISSESNNKKDTRMRP